MTGGASQGRRQTLRLQPDDPLSHPGRSEYRAFSTLLGSLPAGAHQISVEVYTSNGTAIGRANGLLMVTSY